jgi:hypothetical protein
LTPPQAAKAALERAAHTLASVHETDLHGSLALFIEQSDDFRGQLQ